jgi:cellulose synthase/poly-beta-1,6-N-acetylglucosamine synthase-like glycosyltransferase
MEPFSVLLLVILSFLYAWVLYNLSVLVVALRVGVEPSSPVSPHRSTCDCPKFSILVAAKNEERVLRRVLSRLVELDYPRERYEVLVIEDGSNDRTAELAAQYQTRFPALIKALRHAETSGKPAALNFGLGYTTGEIVLVLDADNLPSRDILRKATRYFGDNTVVAVQGRTLPLNEHENLLTKVVASEERAWFRRHLLGKERIGLFVPLTGSCGFIRRQVLESVGAWDDTSLTEDVELAARIVRRTWRVRYASDITSFQEYPSSARQLIGQRTRWARGYMETFLKYGRLLLNPSKVAIDAELTMAGPFVLTLILLVYLVSLAAIIIPTWNLDGTVLVLAQSFWALVTSTVLFRGIVTFYQVRPLRFRNLILIPLVCGYWCLQSLIATRAILHIILRRERIWERTIKTGNMTLNSV